MAEDVVEQPPVNPLFKVLEQKVALNVQLEQDLITTYQVTPNASIILSMRLDLLLSSLLTEDQRYTFEIESADKIYDMLLQIREEMKTRKEQMDIRSRLVLPEPTIRI